MATNTFKPLTSGGAAAATQAEQETGSSIAVFTSPGRQQYHPSAAKAWIQMSATGTNQASYNVTSVSNTASGDNTITFTVGFSSSSYGAAGIGGLNSTSMRVLCNNVTKTGTTFRVQTLASDGGALQDGNQVLVFFGDQ